MEIKKLLEISLNQKASDLHILVGLPPFLRIDRELYPLEGGRGLTPAEIENLVFPLLTEEQKEVLLVNKEIDFSFNFQEKGRFRVNAYYQKGTLAAAFRLLPTIIPQIKEINLPDVCYQFASLKQGFILVTGPTGHGKSTTLAAIIEEINKTRSVHIVTIEDPIEYVFSPKMAIISQREIKSDTHSWQIALRSCLREDPDVVMVGEMRDYETISSALTIAETGHLVFATLHTNSAAQTIDRIVDVFPQNQQEQVKVQLSNTLSAILSERLLPSIRGGSIPAFEILLSTSAVKATIREGKTYLIDNIIQTSTEIGMRSLEMDLSRLVKEGKISLEVAKNYTLKTEELLKLVRK